MLLRCCVYQAAVCRMANSESPISTVLVTGTASVETLRRGITATSKRGHKRSHPLLIRANISIIDRLKGLSSTNYIGLFVLVSVVV